MHQMGLSHSHTAIQKQWVVAARGIGNHRSRRGSRELVTSAHDKGIEGKLGVQNLGSAFQVSPWLPNRRRSRSGVGRRSHFVSDMAHWKTQLANGIADWSGKLGFQPVTGAAIRNGDEYGIAGGANKRRPF